MQEDKLLKKIQDGEALSAGQEVALIASLSLPAILAQLSSVVMQYIDASMVGALGAADSASIGLMSSTLWLVWGVSSAAAAGFSVQVAHRVGAREEAQAQSVVRHGLLTNFGLAVVLGALLLLLSGQLPLWLGGGADIADKARSYLRVCLFFLPMSMLRMTAGSMLQNSGNMKVPSLLNVGMCALDVVFNFLLIFPTRTLPVGGYVLRLPGAGLGVAGAALGTALSEVVCACFLLWFLNRRLPLVRPRATGQPEGAEASLSQEAHAPVRRAFPRQAAAPRYADELRRALQIGLPMAAEQCITGGAYVAFTRIVAPLGTIAIAANSFAITAESLCYMPGYGIGAAATALIGLSTGAGREDLSRRLGWRTVALGVLIQTGMGVLLFAAAPIMIGFLSPDPAIRALGTRVLRIEAFAEPLFAASIIVTGVFRGAGKTLVPSILNFLSMWAVRIPLALFLAPRLGLPGAWMAMCAELCIRGLLFLFWMRREY